MTNLAYAPATAPVRSPRREQPVRRVEIVATRSQRRLRPRPLYALIAVGGLFALFATQLLLSIVVSDGAYQISGLQAQKVALTRTQTSLSEQVDTLASTQSLASKAEGLGMVLSTSTPAFLDAATGKVIGKSKAISGTTTKKAIIDDTGNLVPNSLLETDDDTLADTSTDGTAAGETTDSTGTASTNLPLTIVPADGATGTATVGSTSGAPAGSTGTGSVPSSNTLPVPVIR